jgi:hypothetical protein
MWGRLKYNRIRHSSKKIEPKGSLLGYNIKLQQSNHGKTSSITEEEKRRVLA